MNREMSWVPLTENSIQPELVLLELPKPRPEPPFLLFLAGWTMRRRLPVLDHSSTLGSCCREAQGMAQISRGKRGVLGRVLYSQWEMEKCTVTGKRVENPLVVQGCCR